MIKLNFQKPFTGLEINGSSVRAAQILRGKRGCKLIRCATVPFAEETLKLSYKTGNINDPHAFLETIKEAMGLLEGKVARVGLSVPNEIVRVAVQQYGELPKKKAETERMIAWWAKKSLPFPVEGAKISFHPLNMNGRGEKRLLVTLAFEGVIKEYEHNLRELGVNPEVIRPAGINHFNFYHERIPPFGTIGFLGLFENYFNLFVFEEGELVFHHGIKRGYADIHFFQDIEMTIQLYYNSNPDKEIEKFCYGSQVGFHKELEEGIRSILDAEVIRIDETEILSLDAEVKMPQQEKILPSYASAIGAAQSLGY